MALAWVVTFGQGRAPNGPDLAPDAVRVVVLSG